MQDVAPSEVNHPFYDTVGFYRDSLPFMPLTVEVQIVTQEPKVQVSEVDRVKQKLIEYSDKISKGEMSFETSFLVSTQRMAIPHSRVVRWAS